MNKVTFRLKKKIIIIREAFLTSIINTENLGTGLENRCVWRVISFLSLFFVFKLKGFCESASGKGIMFSAEGARVERRRGAAVRLGVQGASCI